MFFIKRNNIYYVEFFDKTQGKTRRVSTGKKDKQEAINFVRTQNENQNVIHKPEVKTNNIKLSRFKIEYEEYCIPRYSKNYNRSIDLSLRKLQEFIGDVELECIDSRKIESFINQTFIRAKYSSHMYFKTLKAAFNKALQWSYIKTNPFSGIKPPRVQKKLPVFIDIEQLQEIQRHVKQEMLRCLYYAAFYTGLRLGELVNLKWTNIDFNNNMITVGNSEDFITKSKAARIVPIFYQLIPSLVKLKKVSSSDYVFCNQNNYHYNNDYVSKKFKAAVNASGLNKQIKFHTLRHSFASQLAQKGVSLYVIKELLGHGDISTTQIYAHLNNDSLVSAIKKMNYISIM